MDQKDGGPAFPSTQYALVIPKDLLTDRIEKIKIPMNGMSLRDYFAGQALGGLVKNQEHRKQAAIAGGSGWSACCAYDYADAMLAEREKR